MTPDHIEDTTISLHRVNVPSDPNTRCTLDQLLSIFGGAHRFDAERELLRRLREKQADETA